jgi:hypothetical protein
LQALAEAVQLSPGRLMHAFNRVRMGIPLRPYLQWLKVQRAAAAIARERPCPTPRMRPASPTRHT